MKCLLSLLILTNWYIIQGVLEWTVIGKVTEYGQAATLFCNVSNCCPKYAGWDRWAPQRQTLFIDLKTARPNKKYDGKIYRDGYTLIIKNLTEKDLNISYSCIYGVTLGERLFLFEEDVFTYTSTKQPNVSTGNRAFSDGEITGIIVGVIVLLAVPVVCIYLYCWRHRNFSTEGQVANTINSRVEYEKSQIANEADSVVISDDDLDKNTGENTPLNGQITNEADSVVISDDDLDKNTGENTPLIGQIANKADSVVKSDDDLDKNTSENSLLIDTVGKTPLIEISNDLKSMDSKEQGVFMKEIKFRKQIRRYVRVQVIGKNAVGKTSLVRRLLGKNLQDVHSTDGIDITKTCRISTKDGKWSVGEGGTESQETIWRLIQILKMKAEEQKELSSKEKKNESKVMPPIKDNNERNVNAVPKHDETSNDLTNDNNLNNPDGTIKLKKVEPIMENPKSDVNTSEQMSLSDENQESKISNEKMKEVIDEMDQIIALVQQQEAAMAYDGLVECGIWDFAGEKDYYVTHQTFLTPHAIYLLVASLKDDKIEVNGENYDNIEEYIDFWFDSIHCFCENSSDHENNLNPPVILVFTHTDEWLDPEEIAQQSGKKVMKKKEDYKQKIANIIGKRSDHIRGIFFLSNTQFGNEDINTIDQLKQLISNTAKEMEYFAEKLPMEWIQLENALAVLKRDLNTNILSMDNISDLAIKAIGGGIDITAFLNYQHKIGNLIFFDDIKDYIILQPNWLVQCFRCLICDDKKYNENITLLPTTALTQLTETGNISKEIIAKLFKKESHLKFGQYQNHILRVLEKFDIIVKPSFKGTLNNECQKSNLYYMPCMISKTEALEIIKKKYANSFSASPWLTFEFEFLPLAFFNHILLYFVNDYIVCAEEDGEKRKAIYKGKAVFCLDDSGFEKLILCFSKNAISLQIWKEGEVEEVIYKNILEKLNRKIEELNNQLRLKIIFTIKAKCSTGDYSKRAGRLSSEELDKKCKKGKYMCAEHDETHNKGEIWNTWLKHTVPAKIDRCNALCPGLDNTWLDRRLDDKRLGRLAVELTKEETKGIYMHLKERKPNQTWKKIESNKTDVFDININALHDWKRSTHLATFNNIQESMKKEDIDTHKLCQILRDVQINKELPIAKLDLKPSRSDIKILLNHIGKETFQLGIELGLSVIEMHQIQSNHVTNLRGQTEEVLCKWLKRCHATYEVLVKALYRLDLDGVVESLTYDVGVNEQIEDRIRDNTDRIIRDIQISQILDYMMTHLVISVDDRRDIEHYPRQDDQSKALLDIVIKRGEPTYSVFVDGLRNYGYEDIANVLKCDFSPSPTSASAETEGLSVWNFPLYKVRLQKNYLKIITDIQHESIVDHLITRDVLSLDDREKIESGETSQEKNRRLMHMILRKNERGFIELIKALRKGSIYADLAEQIEMTDVTSRDMETFRKCFK